METVGNKLNAAAKTHTCKFTCGYCNKPKTCTAERLATITQLKEMGLTTELQCNICRKGAERLQAMIDDADWNEFGGNY